MLENASFIVERFRQAGVPDYFGDSAINVVGDLASCAIGYAIAECLGRRGSLALLAALEVVLAFWMRDSLFLSMLMLITPLEAIKQWQLAK